MKRLTLLLMLFGTPVQAAPEALSFKVRDWQSATGLQDQDTPYLVCGIEGYAPKRGKDLYEDTDFFAGKYLDGVLVRGFDAVKVYEWSQTLKVGELNSKIEEMLRGTTVYSVRRSKVANKIKISKYDLVSTEVKMQSSLASCLENNPRRSQCNLASDKACCETDASKSFGFQAQWRNSESKRQTWKLRYGLGNGAPIFILGAGGKDEPIRYCHGAVFKSE